MPGTDNVHTKLGGYELLRPVAQGGMAEIYLARKACGRHVAMKLLDPARAFDDDAYAMFMDEARVCALLDHANLAAVLDVDVVDGQHYIAMEYIHGVDCRGLLQAASRQNRSLPFEMAAAIVAAAASGLDHAHRRCNDEGAPLRIVHRDVSLSNIMVGYDGSVKVVDFGIASTAIARTHTMPGVVRGKASYMSPEQCLGHRVDYRTDIFALGIVLYELTTGARCFQGATDFDRMLAIVRGTYVAPSALVPDYPIELEHIIRCALSISPEERFSSAHALAGALHAVAAKLKWSIDATTISTQMASFFGDVPEPWAKLPSSQSITELEAFPLPPGFGARGSAPEITTCARRRLAQGTEPPFKFDTLVTTAPSSDEEDEPTRGRTPIRRAPTNG